MFAGFKNFNPPTEKKLACYPDLPEFSCAWGMCKMATVMQHAIGDLILITFY